MASPSARSRDTDPDPFPRLVEQHRREILGHCYRMLGSWSEAEDVGQEVFLRAWRALERFEGRASVRSWLYRIATNACLTALRARTRRGLPTLESPAAASPYRVDPPDPEQEELWIEPYPDAVLSGTEDGETRAASRQTVTLAFVVALQHLPARQRAVLLLREVVGYEASEVASMLRMTLSAVTSALGRARARLARTRTASAELGPNSLTASQRRLLERYVEAWESGDVEALVALLSRDATFSMPPISTWFRGRRGISSALIGHVFGDERRFRLLPTRANGQLAFGIYKAEHGESSYRGYGIQLVSLGRGGVQSVVTFLVPRLVKAFGLPSELSIRGGRK